MDSIHHETIMNLDLMMTRSEVLKYFCEMCGAALSSAGNRHF